MDDPAPGETTYHAVDTSPGSSAEPYWPWYWDLRYRWAAFDPWTTSFPGSQVAPYVLERDGVASWPSGSYYRVTCSDRAVTPEGLAFPATWPAPGEFSAPLTPGTQVVWWGGGTDISPDHNPRWEIRTRWTAPITLQVLRDAGCARPLLVERYSLGDPGGSAWVRASNEESGFRTAWNPRKDWQLSALRYAALSPWRITCGTP